MNKRKINFNNLNSTWIIAEIGVNHEGDFDVACELVKKAAACNVDAVKFQTFKAEHYVSSIQPERRERAKGFELSKEEFEKLAELSNELGVIFFSTPLHSNDIDMLVDIAPIIKISSGDITHLELIKHAAKTGKPLIVSTGLGTRVEIHDAISIIENERPEIREEGGLVLMHCVSAYPTPVKEANIRNVNWLKDEFSYPVGYSDHTLGIKACELAVAAGAVVIEKHFTYRKEDQDFHDHHISANPEDMALLVNMIREAELYCGNYIRERGESEKKLLEHMRRSIGASKDIKIGKVICAEDLTWLRPAWGIEPEGFNDLIGLKLNRDVKAGDLIKKEDLDHSA